MLGLKLDHISKRTIDVILHPMVETTRAVDIDITLNHTR